jgi:hypothetical protein
MRKALCGSVLIMLMASAAAAQSVESKALEQPQPAYHEYVRSLGNDKDVRSGKKRVFAYTEWVQYCRGEFTGQVVRSRWRRDTTCRKFVNPPSEYAAVAEPVAVVVEQAQPQGPKKPVNWNLMNAWQQAQWWCMQHDMAQCKAAREMERRTPNAVPNLFPAPPAVTFTTPTCGRACGQPWTAEDFAAADAEIARLKQELARLRQQPLYTAPIYTPPPPPIYTPYRYTPPSYSAPSYESNSGSTYDAKSGNRYSWYQDSLGTTHVRGSNLNTGSMWRSTIEKDGDQRGTDSNGNMWRYNPDTGRYINYGTGEMCFGRGTLRTCTGGK